MGGRLKREGIYVYLWLIHVGVQQKLVQHCKATILQLKKKSKVKASVEAENVEKVCACMDSEASLSDFGNEWLRE